MLVDGVYVAASWEMARCTGLGGGETLIIRRLSIERFRGIEKLVWHPAPGLNALVGPADSGKSTVLAALGRLLTPRAFGPASEYDYYRRKLDEGFEVSAVIGDLDDELLRVSGGNLIGWLDGKTTPLPDEGGAEPALHCRVTATADFEVVHELLDGNGDGSPFSSAVRRAVRFARIPTEDIAHNELRLGRGSLLERAVGDEGLRGPLTDALAQASADLALPKPVADALAGLIAFFDEEGLPSQLRIGMISPEGGALLGLAGLLVGEDPLTAIPLARAGSGTRRLALIQLARRALRDNPILAVDEPETGLEPYRQRALIRTLQDAVAESGQVFLTTHSPVVLASLSPQDVWRFAPGREPLGFGTSNALGSVMKGSPDALLARLPVLCEGPTEAGFLFPLLDEKAISQGTPLHERGVHLVARGGQPSVLDEAEALTSAGLVIGLFVDKEDQFQGRRDLLKANASCGFGAWEDVRNVEEAVARWLPLEHLEGLINVAAAALNKSVTSLRQQVCERAGTPGDKSISDLLAQTDEATVRSAIGRTMQEANWFKSEPRAVALGRFLRDVGVPEEIDQVVSAFWNELEQLL